MDRSGAPEKQPNSAGISQGDGTAMEGAQLATVGI
jgi:hypothetical protein